MKFMDGKKSKKKNTMLNQKQKYVMLNRLRKSMYRNEIL